MIFLVVYDLIFVNALISYLRGSLSDPGYVHNLKLVRDSNRSKLTYASFKERPVDLLPEKELKDCAFCERAWKPPRAHHCRQCMRCVIRVKHHLKPHNKSNYFLALDGPSL